MPKHDRSLSTFNGSGHLIGSVLHRQAAKYAGDRFAFEASGARVRAVFLDLASFHML